PAHCPVFARRLCRARARSYSKAVAPPQGNPSFDRGRGAAGTDADPTRAVFQEGGGESGAGTRQGQKATRQARERAYAGRRARDGTGGPRTMIVHVVLALQLVTASAPSSPARLVVRNATRSATVTLLQTAAGPMLPVE